MSILDYYKYALLSTAAYVCAGELDPADSLYGQKFAQLANDQADGRLPLSIAQYLFDLNNAYGNTNIWNIRYYYGGDRLDITDHTGFAATLFQQAGFQGQVQDTRILACTSRPVCLHRIPNTLCHVTAPNLPRSHH